MFGAVSPIFVAWYAKPSFFLQKIKKNDLPQQFFCKIYRIDSFGFKIGFYERTRFNYFIQFAFGANKKFAVFEEKFFGNRFDIERFFQLFQRRLVRIVDKQLHKAALSGMAFFVFPDKERPPSCRCDLFFHFNFFFGYLKCVFHLHQRKAPIFIIGRNKSNQCGVFLSTASTAVQVPRNKISLHGSCPLQRGRFFQSDNQNID